MTDEPRWYLAWHTPPGWVPLPVQEDLDAAEWSLADVRAAAPPDAPAERVEAAAQSLRVALDAAREGPVDGPYVAAAFQPDPLGDVLAWANAVRWPWDESGPFSLDEAEEMLASGGETVGDVTRGRVDLPAGPSVWVQRMFTLDAGAGPFVMEGRAYVILPRDELGWIMLSSQWASLPLGEQLAERVDELAVRILTAPPD